MQPPVTISYLFYPHPFLLGPAQPGASSNSWGRGSAGDFPLGQGPREQHSCANLGTMGGERASPSPPSITLCLSQALGGDRGALRGNLSQGSWAHSYSSQVLVNRGGWSPGALASPPHGWTAGVLLSAVLWQSWSCKSGCSGVWPCSFSPRLLRVLLLHVGVSGQRSGTSSPNGPTAAQPHSNLGTESRHLSCLPGPPSPAEEPPCLNLAHPTPACSIPQTKYLLN